MIGHVVHVGLVDQSMNQRTTTKSDNMDVYLVQVSAASKLIPSATLNLVICGF